MKLTPLFYRTAIIVAVFFVSAFPLAAQQIERFGPSYDIVLQVVVGSNEGQNSELPKELLWWSSHEKRAVEERPPRYFPMKID